MLTQYVLRGVKAGIGAGVAFGAFVALVGNPFIEYAETFEKGGHHGGAAVAGVVTNVISVGGGVLFGILLGGVVFGVGYYFLEPAIPGTGASKSFLLAAGGFLTLSGGPWLVLPPQPPGVEQALPTQVRIMWYLILMVTAAGASGLSVTVYNRLRERYHPVMAVFVGVLPFGLLFIVAAFAPANQVSGPIPAALADIFRRVTAIGQLGLWFVLATVHALLQKRTRSPETEAEDELSIRDQSNRSATS